MRSGVPLVAILLLAGCVSQSGVEGVPPFPCDQTTEFAFVGEATPAMLGLGIAGNGPDANRVGTAWVTMGPVDWGAGPGRDGPVPVVPAERAVCFEFDDGSGMGQSIPDDWELPDAAFDGLPQRAETAASDQPPLLLGLVLAALVITVVAFRAGGRFAGQAP